MGDAEPESEQIRLKCIRKDGFFTVPPEHRVRCGPLEELRLRRRQGGPQGPGPSVVLSAEGSGADGAPAPGFLAAGAGAGAAPRSSRRPPREGRAPGFPTGVS